MESRFSKFYAFQAQGPFDQEPSRVNLLERIKPIVTKWSEFFDIATGLILIACSEKLILQGLDTHSFKKKNLVHTSRKVLSLVRA